MVEYNRYCLLIDGFCYVFYSQKPMSKEFENDERLKKSLLTEIKKNGLYYIIDSFTFPMFDSDITLKPIKKDTLFQDIVKKNKTYKNFKEEQRFFFYHDLEKELRFFAFSKDKRKFLLLRGLFMKDNYYGKDERILKLS